MLVGVQRYAKDWIFSIFSFNLSNERRVSLSRVFLFHDDDDEDVELDGR